MKEPFVEFMKREMEDRMVLIACGLPASYKTETTEVTAALKGYRILRTDLIRLEVLRGEDIFDEKIAGNMNMRTMVYDEMFRLGQDLAEKGYGILFDATFVTQALRRRAAAIAASAGMPLVIQQTRCPKEVSLARIARRSKENYESNALTEQAYLNNVAKFEAVDLDDLKSLHPGLHAIHLIVDTSRDETEKWLVVGKETI
jgi:predicted kinase